MIIKKIIRVGLHAIKSPTYRREVFSRMQQKIRDGSFWSWLWRGFTSRSIQSALTAGKQSQDLSQHQKYIDAIRFNQTPHPEHHVPRTRFGDCEYSTGRTPKFIAYYLPQYHPFEINNKAWGEGFTEWANTTKALPQYKGHYQPHLPADLGFYDLRLPEVMRKQIDLAKSYGVHGFCFHYYWFDGQKVMDLPLNQFLAHPEMDLPFCICWANENWTRRWDGMESEVILAQDYSMDKCVRFIQDILPILQDARYIRVDGKPLLVVYRPLQIPKLEAVVQAWRQQAIQAGLPGLWLVCAQTFGLTDPRTIGFDAAVEFPPHKINDSLQVVQPPEGYWNPSFKGNVWHYGDAVGEAITRPTENYPLYRAAFPSWDNEARRVSAGYSFAQANPTEFGEWLATCASYARETCGPSDNFVFINAWNEWAEGAHLEPDRHFGYAWLEQVARQAARKHKLQLPKLSYAAKLTPSPRQAHTAVVIHMFFLDTWKDIEAALRRIGQPFDLIVTTTSEKFNEVSALVQTFDPAAEIHVVENRGRDIRPFMVVLPLLLHRAYTSVLKLHSKKSLHRMDGDVWRQTLLGQLIPQDGTSALCETLKQYPSLGLIAPEGNVLNIQRYMGSNQGWVDKLVNELGETPQWLARSKPWFAAGTMFWFKPRALQALLACASIQNDLFEQEAGQIDGTLAHAIERVFGCAALADGYHLMDTQTARSVHTTEPTAYRRARKKWMATWGCEGRKRKVDSPFARPSQNHE